MYICVAQSIVCEVCRTVTHAQQTALASARSRSGRRPPPRAARAELGAAGRPSRRRRSAGRSRVLRPRPRPRPARASRRQAPIRRTDDIHRLTRPTPYPQPTYEMRTYSQAHDGDITRNVCESGAERRRRPRDRPATSRGDAVVRTSGPRLGPHRRSTGHLRACQDYQT